MLLLDLFTILWITILSAMIFYWLPGKIFSTKEPLSAGSFAGRLARMVLITIAGVLGLASLHLLNGITLLLFFSLLPILGWLGRQSWRLESTIKLIYRRLLLETGDLFEFGLLRESARNRLRAKLLMCAGRLAALVKWPGINNPQGAICALLFAAVVSITLVIRFERPLFELRLGHPESYSTLLVAKQILAGARPKIGHPVAFPALAAGISLLGSTDPIQVVRFLGPLLGCLLVLGVGLIVRRLTDSGVVALAACYSLGAYIFMLPKSMPLPEWSKQLFATVGERLNESLSRQWAGGDLEMGALFLLLASVCWCGAQPGLKGRAALDTACCLAVVAMTAPSLLILALGGLAISGVALAGRAGLTSQRALLLGVVSGGWLLLALMATLPGFSFFQSALLTLPIGLSLICGLLLSLLVRLFRFVTGVYAEALLLTLFFLFSFEFLMPHSTGGIYLEYDMAARKTVEIATRFPRKRWLIAAPVEQLAEVSGVGWHEDLAQFVDKFAERAGDADFRFPLLVSDLFVFVEKRPFVTFATEPQVVPFAVLADPTYRYYRSPAGRASLEYAALELCESYRRSHTDASIYYEDDALRIYHFRI